ncbi:MAG TPA: hypothetical protein PKW95_02225 [bacterium]|nr:hypothetical protein [bacterium]
MKLRRIALIAMLVSALAVIACDVPNNEINHPGGNDYGNADDDDGEEEDDDITVVRTMETPAVESGLANRHYNPYNVKEVEESNRVFEPNWKDYFRFIDLAADHARPISTRRLWRQFAKIEQELVNVLDPVADNYLQDNDTLVSLITEAINLDFLLDGLNERELVVTTVRRSETDDYYEREMIFSDPYVGDFQGILLTPKTEGPHPAVVAIHGHNETASHYIYYYDGEAYPESGIALLVLSMRADRADEVESQVSQSLLEAGFSFMALRVYETSLALKYLQYLPEIDNERIGLIGHSGGSVTSNLTARINPGFRAYVSDLQGWYFNIVPGPVIIDETTPLLYPYNNAINYTDSYPIPIMVVAYGYVDGMSEILEFFDKHLRDG